MTIVDELIAAGIASNAFHAANMLNKLECWKLASDVERMARCKLYHEWKMAGEVKARCAEHAIAGDAAPARFDEPCTHDTSIILEHANGITKEECTWGCGQIFYTRLCEDGVTRPIEEYFDDLRPVPAEADKARVKDYQDGVAI